MPMPHHIICEYIDMPKPNINCKVKIIVIKVRTSAGTWARLRVSAPIPVRSNSPKRDLALNKAAS